MVFLNKARAWGAALLAAVLWVPVEAQIELDLIGSYHNSAFDEGAAEVAAYDPATQRIFFINALSQTVDILDFSEPESPQLIASISLGGRVNSVAVKNGLVAVAVEGPVVDATGELVLMDTDGTELNRLPAGVLPDACTFTPDGNKVIVCNEGQPADDLSVNPPGSISVIDVSLGAELATVTQIGFSAFDGLGASLINRGVRMIFPGASTSQALEPEYAAVTPDSRWAYISLQENNALAVVELETDQLVDILPLGYKDHSRGLPVLEQYDLAARSLPVLGISTADDSTPILLGGMSGLWFEQSESTDDLWVFYAVPDRGPNGDSFKDADGVTNRQFLLPNYQARIVRLELDRARGKLSVSDQIMLTRGDGTPILGIPNIPGWDERPLDGKGNAIAYDAYGADMEGIVIDPTDGTFWTVDEYRPAIYHFAANGRLIERYVPQGTAQLGTSPQSVGYYGAETLPSPYALRRANRGFEAVALDPERGVVYAFIQTPMYNPDSSTKNASDVIRILGVRTSDGTPVEEYVYLLERNADSGYSYKRTDKMGDAVWAGNKRLYVLERDSSTPDDLSIGHKYIFEINLTGATNLLASNAPAPLAGKTLEQHTAADLATAGIRPVSKVKVANLPSLGYMPSDKPEGLALVPGGGLAVINDNDFTMGGYPDIALGVIHFSKSTVMDASNRDGGINFSNWPVWGMFQPDAIAAYQVDGVNYIVTANEGDAVDYDGYSEEARVKDLQLDPQSFPDAGDLQTDEKLGRLKTTLANGDLDGDGDNDRIFAYGARSFSIFDQYGNLVFDSGSDFERITAQVLGENFNSTNDENDSADSRSDDKGPEPEALALGRIDGRMYAFIGLERDSGIFTYDISDPYAPFFVSYENSRDFNVLFDPDTVTEDQLVEAVALGPETLVFIGSDDSPNGNDLLVAANEINGAINVYEVRDTRDTSLPDGDAKRSHLVVGASVTKDGVPLGGVRLEAFRAVSGRNRTNAQSGITSSSGFVQINVVTTGMRSGGYYDLRAVDTTSGATLGYWRSLPLRAGHYTELTLSVGEEAKKGMSYPLTAAKRPSESSLLVNYPNPFNPRTTISFDVREAGHVQVAVYSALGQRVRTLVDGYHSAGRYDVAWNARDQRGQRVSSGIYFYRLETATETAVRQMLLLK